MKLPITRVDKSLPMPKYETAGSVAFDVYARTETTIEAGQLGYIPTNLIVNLPSGYAFLICARSSTPGRKGLSIPHGFGIIDQDYCGPEDEIRFMLYNFTDKPITVERGERIAQAMVIETPKVELTEQELATTESRGGFGSTGF